VLIKDDSAKIIIRGNYGTYNEKTDSIKVWENSIFIQQDSSDTINIYADQFIRYQDSLKELIICYNNVVINGNLIDGDCDSIYYNKTDSTLKCIKDPIIWLDENQVTGEKIEFKISEGEIYNMSVTNNSMIITRKDSIHYDQIKGDKINGHFKNNELNILDVNKNGKAIYYSNDEKDSLINEINIISCESMKINIKENKIEKIRFKTKPKGKTLPLDEAKKDFYLDNFKIITKRSYHEKKGLANGELPKGR
jgi:lipopolysaccharide export system protein LptA